jgi:hypothetical protein
VEGLSLYVAANELLMHGSISPLVADLEIDSARAAAGADRDRILLRSPRTTVEALCAVAGISYRVAGGNQPLVVLWGGPGHAYTVTDHGGRIFAVDRNGLPRLKRERALRVLEILAYGFFDYAARESIVGRGYFIPPTPTSAGSSFGR